MCMAVTGKVISDVFPTLRQLPGLSGCSDEAIMSVLVAAYLEKHYSAQLDVWETAIAKVEGVVGDLVEKVREVLAAGVLA